MIERSPATTIVAKLVEAIGAEVTLIDSEARVIMSTAGSRAALGYDEMFWQATNLFDLAHPDDVGRANEALIGLLSTPGGSAQARFRARHANGHWETIDVYGKNLLAEPAIGALILTTRSVTEEEDLRAAHQEGMRTTSLQAEYVASVSHELRSPLQGILGVAQLLENKVTGEPAALVNIIRDEADRLRRVIDDILDYAKVAQGGMKLQPRPTELRRLLDAVASIVHPQLLPGVALDLVVDPAIDGWVVVDDLRLHQIILNLASNAVRFTAEGTITIRCWPTGSGRLCFSVVDTGTGIDQAHIESLFEPFQQGVPSQHHRGTGLGLTVSKKLIELMGGRLDVESRLGAGSTFSFAVDAPATMAAAATASSGVAIIDGKQTKALVVDDAEVNRLVIGRQLQSMGFDVDKADGGAVGVEMAIAMQYELIVMDWHMPELDGLEATRRIRSHESAVGRHTPILSMTASAMAGDKEKCLAAGVDGFLAKPATRSELAEAVSAVLSPDGQMTAGLDARSASAGGQDQGRSSSGHLAVDHAVLDSLAEQLGDVSTVISVVETYLGDLDARSHAISDAIRAQQPDTTQREAHTLKSPSQMLGAMQLGRFCHDVELGEIQPTAQTIDELERHVEAATHGLRVWMDQLQEDPIS